MTQSQVLSTIQRVRSHPGADIAEEEVRAKVAMPNSNFRPDQVGQLMEAFDILARRSARWAYTRYAYERRSRPYARRCGDS